MIVNHANAMSSASALPPLIIRIVRMRKPNTIKLLPHIINLLFIYATHVINTINPYMYVLLLLFIRHTVKYIIAPIPAIIIIPFLVCLSLINAIVAIIIATVIIAT